MIDVIFNDIDGCMVPRDYDPLRIVLDEAASERHFAYYRTYTGPQIVLCTGRGWADTRGILERAQYFPRQRATWPHTPVLCEHGMDVVIDPVADTHVALIDEVPALRRLRPSVEPIRRTGMLLQAALPSVSDTLSPALRTPSGTAFAAAEAILPGGEDPILCGHSGADRTGSILRSDSRDRRSRSGRAACRALGQLHTILDRDRHHSTGKQRGRSQVLAGALRDASGTGRLHRRFSAGP